MATHLKLVSCVVKRLKMKTSLSFTNWQELQKEKEGEIGENNLESWSSSPFKKKNY